MALTHFLLPTCLVLLSLLLINVSATDYGYGPKPPQVEQPKPPQVQKPEPPQLEKPKPPHVEKPTPPQVSATDYGYGPKPPQVEQPKPPQVQKPIKPPQVEKPTPPQVSATDYGYGPKPPQVEQPKPPQVQKPIKPPQVEKPTPPQVSTNDYGHGPKPQVEKPKLDQLYGELLPHNLFGIQGLVLCNSGLKAFPIQGAVARITCVGEDENGYETAPFSILSGATDAMGYFFATLSPSKLEGNYNNKWKLTECKTFLDNSPLESCKVPTDVNHGISGALIASYRTLNAKNMKLFSVGPFFYSSEPKPAPSGY
ncbi:hypothetical protein RchiOBHm_Chr6g0294431 [Rosa chinensis]|uniref:Pollen allergen Ole e 1 family n=1 Tax=Rosa chinensis TaxID=74649 RepID=A0A2P6PWY0_ROSCH|nr:proline-rich protein 3 [Rosa chinensis]PRQ26425.1 hypothetical protein RchiOBHm_Chr6g0294431 [Rosa chinensis]